MTEPVDPKEKFREALEKKRKSQSSRGHNTAGKSKISNENSTANSPKMFRRKSGSA